MILYRIETNGTEQKGYEWWSKKDGKDGAIAQARAMAEEGISTTVHKINVPTSKDDLVNFLNMADAVAGNLAEMGIEVEPVRTFEAKE